jgi:hypothetical protein
MFSYAQTTNFCDREKCGNWIEGKNGDIFGTEVIK